MKWLPEPSEPSCSRQFGAIASALSAPSRFSSSAIRWLVPLSWTVSLYCPADSGTAFSIASRSRASAFPRRSSRASPVRTAIMPQPMSTPTAAGMIAPSVGITDPTVAPFP